MEEPAAGGRGRRRRHRPRHHRRRANSPRGVRMRFAWWHLGVALLSIAFGGWLLLAIQPWSVHPPPPLVSQ
jgi:hypothetical protein